MIDARNAFRMIERKRKNLLAAYVVTMCLALCSLVCLFLFRNLFFPSLAATLLFYLIAVLPLDKAYNREFIRDNFLLGTAEGRDGATVDEKGQVSDGEIISSGLFPLPASGKRRAVTGLSLSVPVDGEMISIREILSYYRLPEGSDKHKVAIIKGIWISVPLKHGCGIEAGVIRKNALHPSVREDFYSAEGFILEDGKDDWDGCLFFADGKKSMERLYALLPDVYGLYQACSSKSGSMMFRISNNCLYLLDYGRSLDFDAPVRKGLDISVLTSNRVPEFQKLLELSETIQKKN